MNMEWYISNFKFNKSFWRSKIGNLFTKYNKCGMLYIYIYNCKFNKYNNLTLFYQPFNKRRYYSTSYYSCCSVICFITRSVTCPIRCFFNCLFWHFLSRFFSFTFHLSNNIFCFYLYFVDKDFFDDGNNKSSPSTFFFWSTRFDIIQKGLSSFAVSFFAVLFFIQPFKYSTASFIPCVLLLEFSNASSKLCFELALF